MDLDKILQVRKVGTCIGNLGAKKGLDTSILRDLTIQLKYIKHMDLMNPYNKEGFD